MNTDTKKALRNLKVGGIYTPICFGILLLGIDQALKLIDSSGSLANEFNSLSFYNPPTVAIGGVLLFFSINTYIYFQRYLNELKKSESQLMAIYSPQTTICRQ
jgi:hypothetical protein